MRILGLLLLVFLTVGCGETSERSGTTSHESGDQAQTTISPGMETTMDATQATSEPAQASKLRTVTIHASSGKEVRVRAEIADDAYEQLRGLMYRTALGEDRGMLFVYPEAEERSFWMKNTLIPLSVAFMDSEGRIVDIDDMKPLDDDPPSYVSAEPAQYALEVNQGFFEEHGVEVGDRVDLPV